jgi:hypothetical protein
MGVTSSQKVSANLFIFLSKATRTGRYSKNRARTYYVRVERVVEIRQENCFRTDDRPCGSRRSNLTRRAGSHQGTQEGDVAK